MSGINEVTRRLGGMPPDPEGLNETRGNTARKTLEHFCTEYPTDWDDGLADLLTNLMHMCDRIPLGLDPRLDFKEELARARRNYESETTPE